MKIPVRYPAVELATGFLSALVAVNFGATWLTLALLLFVWALVALTMIDFDHQLLPDNITLPLLWLGLAVNTWDLGTGVTTQESVLEPLVATYHSGRFIGFSNWQPARKAWVMVTLSCLPR